MDLRPIIKALSEGETENALNLLLAQENVYRAELTLLKARYENLKKKVMAGSISEREEKLEINSINAAIMEAVEGLKKASKSTEIPSAKTTRTKNSRSLTKTVLLGFLALLLLIIIAAIAIPSMMNQSEGEKEKQETITSNDEKPSAPTSSSDEAEKRIFEIIKIGSERGGKFVYEIKELQLLKDRMALKFMIKNGLPLDMLILSARLTDKSENRTSDKMKKQKAFEFSETTIQTGQQADLTAYFKYDLGQSRDFYVEIDYCSPKHRDLVSTELISFKLTD